MVEKILNNTTPYGKIRASHEGSLHSSTLKRYIVMISLGLLDLCILQKRSGKSIIHMHMAITC